MSEKKKKSTKSTKAVNDIQMLCTLLKCDAEKVMKLAHIEKKLMQAKRDKLAAKCKVYRASSRALQFYRHEHEAETIATLQRVADSIQ